MLFGLIRMRLGVRLSHGVIVALTDHHQGELDALLRLLAASRDSGHGGRRGRDVRG